MIPTQQFTEFPEFGNNATKIAPDPAKYAQGFLPADVLPAEWLNYFLNGSTKGVTALANGTRSIEQEINNVITDRGLEPSVNDSTQLLQALEKIKKEAILAAHPVGSLYWTSSNENPAITFGGGTWVQIKDRFVLAAGDTYTTVNAGNNTTGAGAGGEATHVLTEAELPSHRHYVEEKTTTSSGSHIHSVRTFTSTSNNNNYGINETNGKGVAFTTGSNYNYYDACDSGSAMIIGQEGSHTHSISEHYTYNTGNDVAHNNMPPYIVKFCWERTA